MSLIHEFRQRIVIAIDIAITENMGYLVNHTQADLAAMRLYQGRIAGLEAAKAMVNECYKELHG